MESHVVSSGIPLIVSIAISLTVMVELYHTASGLQVPFLNRWLHEQEVSDMRTLWITLYYLLRADGPGLSGRIAKLHAAVAQGKAHAAPPAVGGVAAGLTLTGQPLRPDWALFFSPSFRAIVRLSARG